MNSKQKIEPTIEDEINEIKEKGMVVTQDTIEQIQYNSWSEYDEY